MAIKYNSGYERLVQLVQQGGPQALNAMKESRQSRKGYMSPTNISMIEEDGDTDTSLEIKFIKGSFAQMARACLVIMPETPVMRPTSVVCSLIFISI